MKSVFEHLYDTEKNYDQVYEYLDKYKEPAVMPDEYRNPDVIENKTIWILWFQGMEHAPALVRRCVNSIYQHKPDDFSIVLLDDKNIEEYIVLPDFMKKKFYEGKISKTHMSDLIRIELLALYGGCWIDATVFCSDAIPKYMLDGDLFMFKASMIGESVLKNSSWWIYAKKGNALIGRIRSYLYNYWLREDELLNYYLLHIIMSRVIDEDSSCAALYRSMPYVCNANPHVLYANMEMLYEKEKWNIIKENSKVHKLSYKRFFLQGDIDNFYCAFIEGRLV
jgi:hypothetical protein